MHTDSPYLQLLEWAWSEKEGVPFTQWLLGQRDSGRSLREIRDDLLLRTSGAVSVSPTTLMKWENEYRAEESATTSEDAA